MICTVNIIYDNQDQDKVLTSIALYGWLISFCKYNITSEKENKVYRRFHLDERDLLKISISDHLPEFLKERIKISIERCPTRLSLTETSNH